MKAKRIRHEELEPFGVRFDPATQDVRVLVGSEHGLRTTIMHSTVAPGHGPRRHRHPHAEVFVLHEGAARYEVDGEVLEAEAGDVVIVPPEAWHAFTATGDRPLRMTAVHENPRPATSWEDGTSRE